MVNIKTIKEIKELKGKRALVRVDFNLPIEYAKDRVKIIDDSRLKLSLPTIEYLMNGQAKVILMSHLGRPTKNDIKKLSLKPIAERLSKLLGEKVDFVNDSIGYEVKEKIKNLKNGRVLLLENLRFYGGEDNNEHDYVKQLAANGDFYINDAFAFSHRPTASIVGITSYLPSYAGFLMEREIKKLSYLLDNPKKPFVALIGGLKISDKAETIKSLLKRCDKVLLGGAMANTFFKAGGHEIGKSVYEKKEISLTKELLKHNNILLPVDVIIERTKVLREKRILAINSDSVSRSDRIYDIGPQTIKVFSKILSDAQTIVWNGPMGLFEKKEFNNGSIALARKICQISRGKAYGVAGGGETLAVLKQTGISDHMDFISSGGGAMLEFLEGKSLPGIKALNKY